MIKLENVSFSYDDADTPALKDVNITIEEGDFVALIGHNGSGKSTLAKLINGLLLPSEGTVYVSGMKTSDDEHLWDIRQQVGMIFQNPDNQIVASIVEEDVAFGPENLGVPTEEIQSRVSKALAEVRMSEYYRRPPHMLSGGQKQRIAIAGVLAMQPKVIVFDEATSMLDPKGRKEVMAIMGELHEKGITIIHITHFMEEVLHAQYAYVLDEGRVVLRGKPHELFESRQLLEDLKLDIPVIIDLVDRLRKNGIDVGQVITLRDLVEVLCPSR